MLQPMCRKVLSIPPCPTLGPGHRSPIHLKYGPPGGGWGEERGGGAERERGEDFRGERVSDEPGARNDDGWERRQETSEERTEEKQMWNWCWKHGGPEPQTTWNILQRFPGPTEVWLLLQQDTPPFPLVFSFTSVSLSKITAAATNCSDLQNLNAPKVTDVHRNGSSTLGFN